MCDRLRQEHRHGMTNVNDTAVPADTPIASTATGSVPAQAHRRSFQSVEKWDFRKSSALTTGNIRAIAGFHGAFARGMSRSLAFLLSTGVEIGPAAGRETLFGDVTARAPQGTVFAVFYPELQPLPVILQLDGTLVSTVLDLLLGGTGDQAMARVELTDLDIRMLSEIGRLVASELQAVWRDLGVRLKPEADLEQDIRRQLPAAAGVLALTFGVKLASCDSSMSLLLSSAMVDRIVQSVEACTKQVEVAPAATLGSERSELLREVPVQIALELPALRVSVRDLTNLAPGLVLQLPLAANQLAKVLVAEQEVFTASPVKSGSWRAAKIDSSMMEAKERPESV